MIMVIHLILSEQSAKHGIGQHEGSVLIIWAEKCLKPVIKYHESELKLQFAILRYQITPLQFMPQAYVSPLTLL